METKADSFYVVFGNILPPMADAQAPAVSPEKRNVLSVLLDIFFDPKAAFREIVARPNWWFPLLLSLVFALTFSYLLSTHIGWDTLMRKVAETSDQMQSMPKEQREATIAMQVKFAGIFAYVGPLVFVPVGAAVIAAVLMFIFNNLFGGEVKFKQSFGIVAWSWVPTLLGTIVSIILLFVKSPEDIDINNPVPFNIGYYLSDKVPHWLMSLGSSVDLFSIWTAALLAAGFSVATRKPWLTCLWGVLLPWLAWIVIKVGWAAIRG
jgi:hypothetical protein